MLVLTRGPGEEIVIGEQIRVVVNRIKGQKVSLAIEAPRAVNIRRGELPPLAVDGQPLTEGQPRRPGEHGEENDGPQNGH